MSFRAPTNPVSPNLIRLFGVVGLAYMVGAVVSSILYVSVSAPSFLSNDMLWVDFGENGTQAFLCNWFNSALQTIGGSSSSFQISSPIYGAYVSTSTNQTSNHIWSSTLYAAAIQDQVNDLSNVVASLRQMDGCQLPWIATAYCYADFNQRWAMAYSARRQQRCQDERANGAVFLEAILRNADWPSLNACWGSALTTAVLAPIQASGNDGVAWFKSVQGNALSVAAEVASWRATGIDRFTTQWQNYKRLGVVETFAVKSALGLDYPFTLKDFSSAFQQSSTSLKWYWGFANDLRAIASNSSVLAGRSLIQRTPHYAFENTTLEAAMVRQLVVPTPMDPGLALVIASVGPFGVVDLRRVAVPQALRDLYRRMSQFLTSKLAASEAIQTAFWPLMTTTNYGPQPSIWDNGVMFGGNIHCGVNLATPSDNQVNEYFSAAGVCPNNLPEHVTSSTQDVLLAILAVGFAHMHNATTWTTVGKRGSAHAAAVVQTLNSSTTFLADHFYENELGQFDADVAPVQAAIRDTVQLEFVQFLRLRGAGPYVFSHVNVFAATEPDLAFFTWLYLFDWVQGTREVISLVGDMGTITTISTFQNVVQHPTNAFEIQTHSSLYLYSLIVYITALLVAVGVVVIVYILVARGYVEGTNIVSFNYVAGHVWI
ncbi:hypothetical protein As57867_006031, partial [Aphanomyces stellatus]